MDGKSINRRKNINRRKKQKTKLVSKNQPQKKISRENLTENKDTSKKKNLIYIVIISLVTFIVFSPTFKNDFTNWDDGKYIKENPFIKPLNFETVKNIFASEDLGKRYWMGNYHPLTMLSLNINYAFSSKDDEGNAKPFAFQLINVLLHVFNSLLVFFIIKFLVKNRLIAFGAALLFGVHTFHVESVSWIAERKDVLYTFFFLLSLLFYIKYTEKFKFKNYLLAFILFILSLLSKGQAVSLAVTLLLVDIFRERNLLKPKLIFEKIPFFVLALIFGLIAIEAQKQGNALQVIHTSPLLTRIGVAGYGFTMYLLKLILPVNLCAVYPYPDIIDQTIPAYFWLGLIPIIILAYIAVKTYKSNKILFFGIGFFMVNIALLLQLIPVGSAMYADRYVYIPSIGFYLILSYFLYKIKDKRIKYSFFTAYIVLLSVLTVVRIGDWRDSFTLWQDVINKQEKSVVAWNNLGSVYNRKAKKFKEKGELEKYKEYTNKAIECFSNGIKRKPDYKSAFYNRGFSKYNLGESLNDTSLIFSAIQDYNKAISVDVEFYQAYLQRGIAYDWLGQYNKAISDYNYILDYLPNNIRAMVNMGITKGKTGDLDAAINTFNKVLDIDSQSPAAYSNRGLAYAFKKQYKLALKDYNKALELKEEGNTYYNRAMVYYNLKEYQKALSDFQSALNLNFRVGDVYYYKAVCEKKLDMNNKACQDMQTAAKLNFPPAIQKAEQYCN